MPPEARVFIAEDSLVYQSKYTAILASAGHEVVLVASTMEEVDQAIPKLGELEVQVALVDGNLTPEASDGSEGCRIARQIKQVYPDIGIVGVSLSSYGVDGADINVNKLTLHVNPFRLSEVVTKL